MGDYRVVAANGTLQAQGTFHEGKMDGRWLFFDSHVKVAEVAYLNGAASGPYRTYFGSIAFPAAAGKPESEGHLQNGRTVGRFVSYSRTTGQVDNEATFDASGAVHPKFGAGELAVRLADADQRFVQFLGAQVHAAVR